MTFEIRHIQSSKPMFGTRALGKQWRILFCFLLLPALAWSNNLRFSGLELLNEDRIAVTVSWENAWQFDQGIANHDAIWVFGKQKNELGEWEPLRFGTSAYDYLVETGTSTEVQPTNDQMGCFIVPISNGSNMFNDFRLEIPLASGLRTGIQEIRLFGLEMVWVAEGNFWLGDGQSQESFVEGQSLSPFQVTSESTIDVDSTAGSLYGSGDHPPGIDIPFSWPKGHAGFYCMKYELGQEQYADFLNTLTFAQQQLRSVADPGEDPGTLAMSNGPAHRNGIRIYQPGQPGQPAAFSCDANQNSQFLDGNDGPGRACNFLNWGDLAAYLDWAGLSPLTEFEYEKACRGPLQPIALEFAWGTAFALDANDLEQDGSPWEASLQSPGPGIGLASHGYDGPQGPLRSGFAATATSNREQAGAGFWGIMELSGNLWEICVQANVPGLGFTGSNGDGRLSDAGEANQNDWPSANGMIYRGGGWNSGVLPGFRDLAVSDRFYADLAPNQRRNTSGGRGGRR